LIAVARRVRTDALVRNPLLGNLLAGKLANISVPAAVKEATRPPLTPGLTTTPWTVCGLPLLVALSGLACPDFVPRVSRCGVGAARDGLDDGISSLHRSKGGRTARCY